MNDLLNELDEMSRHMSGEVVDDSTDPPPTDPPGTESPGTEAPGTEAPSTETPTTEPPFDFEEEYKKSQAQIDEMRKKIDEMSDKSPKTESPKTETPTTDAPIEDITFIDNEDTLDELTRDPKKFNQLLNTVFKKGIEFSQTMMKNASAGIVKGIPDIVNESVTTYNNLAKVKKDFYDKNEDLKPFPKAVGYAWESVIAENPGKPLDELLIKVADKARSDLNLHKVADANRRGKPRLPKPRKGVKGNPKPKTDSLQSEIDEMNKEIGR